MNRPGFEKASNPPGADLEQRLQAAPRSTVRLTAHAPRRRSMAVARLGDDFLDRLRRRLDARIAELAQDAERLERAQRALRAHRPARIDGRARA